MSNYITHTVREGDTSWAIARAHDLLPADLQDDQGRRLRAPESINPGQVIRIPVSEDRAEEAPPPPTVQTARVTGTSVELPQPNPRHGGVSARAEATRTESTAPAAPAVEISRSLRRGSEGEDVRALQRALLARGYVLDVDGDFGPDTEREVRNFQRRNGINPIGVAGPRTIARLFPQGTQPDTSGQATATEPHLEATIREASGLQEIGDILGRFGERVMRALSALVPDVIRRLAARDHVTLPSAAWEVSSPDVDAEDLRALHRQMVADGVLSPGQRSEEQIVEALVEQFEDDPDGAYAMGVATSLCARVAHCENRQDADDRAHVMNVICNRAATRSSEYGVSADAPLSHALVQAACHPWAFQPMHERGNHPLSLSAEDAMPDVRTMAELVVQERDGSREDPTSGATLFHANYISPPWNMALLRRTHTGPVHRYYAYA